MKIYDPPKQNYVGQVLDVLILLTMTIGALYLPIFFGLAGATMAPHPIADPTWEKLGQNAVEQQQWASLGITDPAAANDIITARFDYSFSWTALIVIIALVFSYFLIVVKLSDKEYRDVIAERFGEKDDR